jgi:RecA/RadA recombinase
VGCGNGVRLVSVPTDEPLGAARARDVLRYWLASIRLEESLKVRPRAQRARAGTTLPRIDHPSAGQDYFKLPRAELARALDGEPVVRELDAELSAFFEGWLLQQYRRGADDSELAHVASFPVVHLPRGELAGLLRRGVKLRFGSRSGATFRVPTRNERRLGQLPPPPEQATIGPVTRQEDAWPFFVDTRLLSYPLGVSSEHIDALFESLRERGNLGEQEMLGLVTAALEAAARELGDTLDDSGAPLPRLLHAMQCLLRRSPTRAEVYPVGIVVDGTQAKTSWHLQRELVSLLADDAPLEGPLGAYLTGRPLPDGEAPQRALYPGAALTAHQRVAAERFWGSPFSAVQGPPGTGKTTLILHLCAEALTRQVDALLDRQAMGSELLLIASGNNRAVDNVIDPLTAQRALPLALRVGSRQVCEQQLGVQLRGVAAWLAQADVETEPLRQRAYARALADYADTRERVTHKLAPHQQALASAAERARLTEALASLPAIEEKQRGISLERARMLDGPLRKLVKRLEALSELCTAKPTLAHVAAVARHYQKTASRELHALETALAEAGLRLEVPLPPLEAPLEPARLMEAWEDGAETFLTRLAALREDVAGLLEQERHAATRQQLERQLEALGPNVQVPAPEQDDALSLELFTKALEVRESWAKVHARSLRSAVEAATQLVEQERSLRPLFRDAPTEAKLLIQLFGVWGSTLLSLGNCLPAEPELVVRTIVDEAGQCHPAHVVSALMRAKHALIVGDVHQLPPVIELTRDDDARLVRGTRPKLNERALAPYRVHAESQVSAQALADRAVRVRHSLVDHFRCQPEIIAVSDALCGYGLTVHPPPPDHASRASLLPHALCLRDLRGEQARHAGSLWNELELRETLQLVMLLLARGVVAADIAVITPYRGQLDQLRRGLLEHRVPLEQSVELAQLELPALRTSSGLALGTVHRFQGGERSIVLFSSVVSHPRSLGFLNERPNLLNVAISRAQQHFVCLGDRETLRKGALTRVLVEAASPFPSAAL